MERVSDRTGQRQRRIESFDRIGGPTWNAVYRQFSGADLEAWTDCFDRLCREAGPTIAPSFARATLAWARQYGATSALELGWLANGLRTASGNDVARLVLDQSLKAMAALPDVNDSRVWLDAMARIERESPNNARPVLQRIESVLSRVDAAGFAAWISAGLSSEGQRDAYFSFSDPVARRVLDEEAGAIGFDVVSRQLKAFTTAIWGVDPTFRTLTASSDRHSTRRAMFDRELIRFPESFPGFPPAEEVALYHAGAAHIGAHLRFSGARFTAGTLKPMQIALVSLIEDARVETLAGRRFPGLLRLWRRFHVAEAVGPNIAEALMARLARALIDPGFQDDSPWVRKGVALFQDSDTDLDDPAASRRIGMLLGNDLGQMRVQFNAKTHVVEPAYRDDGNGLWDFGEPPADAEEIQEDVVLSARRVEEETENGHPRQDEPDGDGASPVRPVGPDPDIGVPVARYPEWDRRVERMRPDWSTIMEYPPRPAQSETIDRVLDRYRDVRSQVAALVGRVRVSRPMRIRRQPEGDRLDVDACIRAAIDRRIGIDPDGRVYETTARLHRDLSILLLLDISESTKDPVGGTADSVFSLERAATALLADGMSRVGDPFALHAFCSDGRHDVRYYRVKDFKDAYGPESRARLAGLRPGLSTRMGTALRHAVADIAPQPTHRRLVLVVTDGEPSDIDMPDGQYLVEDARKAAQESARKGIDIFCVGLAGAGESQLHRIFGRRNVLHIDKVSALPAALPKLYFRLTS